MFNSIWGQDSQKEGQPPGMDEHSYGGSSDDDGEQQQLQREPDTIDYEAQVSPPSGMAGGSPDSMGGCAIATAHSAVHHLVPAPS